MNDESSFYLGNKNTLVAHPSGELSFGYIPNITFKGHEFLAGHIYLPVGKHTGPNKGFGIKHIWHEHSKEMKALGLQSIRDVPEYVGMIIKFKAPIFCEFDNIKGVHRTTVLSSSVGSVVLEAKNYKEFCYTVVTAFSRKNAIGTQIGSVGKAPK